MTIKNKNRILKYVKNCGLKTTKYMFIDKDENVNLKTLSLELSYPIRIISGEKHYSYSILVEDAVEFIRVANVYLNNYGQILVARAIGERVKREYINDKRNGYEFGDCIKKLFTALGKSAFEAYGYEINDEFYIEEILLPGEVIAEPQF